MLSMSEDSHRLRHLQSDPRLSLSVLGDDWYSHVSFLARAVESRPDTDFADIDVLSMRYEGVALRGSHLPRRDGPRRDRELAHVGRPRSGGMSAERA